MRREWQRSFSKTGDVKEERGGNSIIVKVLFRPSSKATKRKFSKTEESKTQNKGTKENSHRKLYVERWSEELQQNPRVTVIKVLALQLHISLPLVRTHHSAHYTLHTYLISTISRISLPASLSTYLSFTISLHFIICFDYSLVFEFHNRNKLTARVFLLFFPPLCSILGPFLFPPLTVLTPMHLCSSVYAAFPSAIPLRLKQKEVR